MRAPLPWLRALAARPGAFRRLPVAPALRGLFRGFGVSASGPLPAFCLVVALVLSGCEYRPKNATIIRIGGKRVIDSATLTPPATEEQRKPLRLKIMDENTFQTNTPLAPGTYRLRLRASDGLYLARDLAIEREKWFYDLPEIPAESHEQAVGPALSAGIFPEGEMPGEVVVLFIADDVIIRRAAVNAGRFSVRAPAAGTYRVEIIAPGQKPRVWIRDGLKLGADTDVGLINIR